MTEEVPLVSVIVPVRHGNGTLHACLDALGRQTWPASRLEVLVVDNGGKPGSVEAAAAGRAGVRVLREAAEGSYAARNRGLAEARGSILAFTDADCIPAPDWIERGAARLLADPGLGLVAGRIRLTMRDPAAPTAVELYETVASFRQRHYLERLRFGATANVLTTRVVVERVGTFDPILRSLGDVDWGVRVHEAGFRQAYAEEAVVDHPARRTLAEFRARSARMTGGYRDLGRTGRWPLTRRLRYAATGLPPLGRLLPGRGIGGPLRRARILGVGAMVVAVRVLTLLRLTAGGNPGR